MPAGYGDDDDVLKVIETSLENGIDFARSQLRGQGTEYCLDCGEKIPDARRKALPSVTYCIQCQSDRDGQAYKTPYNRRAHHDALLR